MSIFVWKKSAITFGEACMSSPHGRELRKHVSRRNSAISYVSFSYLHKTLLHVFKTIRSILYSSKRRGWNTTSRIALYQISCYCFRIQTYETNDELYTGSQLSVHACQKFISIRMTWWMWVCIPPSNISHTFCGSKVWKQYQVKMLTWSIPLHCVLISWIDAIKT